MARTLALAFLATLATAVAAAPAPTYHLAAQYKLPGDGGWDMLSYDPTGKRLFLSRSTQVLVVDAASGRLQGTIEDTQGVHGIALAPELGKGYTSNGKEDTVTVFDLKTLKPAAKIKVTGESPDEIIYEPVTRRVFAFNGHSSNVTVIDAASDTVTATLALPGKPEFAVADGKGAIYVNLEDKNALARLDAQKPALLDTWALAPCESPSGLAFDAADRRLFAACDNQLMAVVDADTGKLVTTLPIGAGPDGAAYDPATKLLFSPNGGDGTLTVIHVDGADHFTVVATVATHKFARTLALDTDTHALYLPSADVEITPAPAGATGAAQRPKRNVLPGTFTLLVMSPQKP
jgi:YVTN family beta-propeller protein